jgi:hypothetical protein
LACLPHTHPLFTRQIGDRFDFRCHSFPKISHPLIPQISTSYDGPRWHPSNFSRIHP